MNRLYWKIFIWFWFALALLSLSIGWGVKVYVEQARPLSEQLPQAQVAAISLAFERGDTRKARNLLKELNREIRFPIFVVNSQQDDILGRRLPRFVDNMLHRNKVNSKLMLVTEVTLPNGEIYQVIAPKTQPLASESPPPRWLALLITLVISTLVCFWLARYLSSPIGRLRDATHRLAGGEFSVRVGDLGGRKDEIADLAADFDSMADKIQQLLHSRQQLLQDISHELRSPLARLQVALALARREGTGALDRIERDLLRLDALIEEVLALSRLESSPDIMLDEMVDLSTLVAGIINDSSLEAGQKPCTLDARIAPTVMVEGNAELLRRAIENIIRNAIKYTAADTSVHLTLTVADQQVLIQVCDEGAGVDDTDLATIFDPFVRLDSARERQTGGYGLGLAIASKAVELHGGRILARNREGSAGLCVELALPRYK